MRQCSSVCDIALSRCFGHPSHLLTYFSWESLHWHLNQMWIQLSDSHSHQSLHGAIHFVAFRNRIHSCTYAMESHLYIFYLLSDSQATYIESRLKTTHHLFKWCRWVKVVFIAVYLLHFLIIWNCIYFVRVKMATGNSAKQQCASLNKLFLSNTFLFVYFYCKYMFICRQVKYCRYKNK